MLTKNTPCFLTGLLVTMLCAPSVQGDLIISAPSLTVTPGSMGHFAILLTNTGPRSSNVSEFGYYIGTNNPDISFTDAKPCVQSTGHPLPMYCSGEPPYIFAETSATLVHGVSSIADPTAPPGAEHTPQKLYAVDGAYHQICCDLGPASVVSLGEIFYSIAPSSSLGPADIAFIPTNPGSIILGDKWGYPVSSTTRNGAFDVVPEPGRLEVVGCLLLLAFGLWHRLSRKRTTP